MSTTQQILATSIAEQYKDAAYSDFVEANLDFYHHYLHYSFCQELENFYNTTDSGVRAILDMGCGNGILSRKIWRQSGCEPQIKIYAVDLMDSMLDRARELCQAQRIPLLSDYDPSSGSGGIYLEQGNLLDTSATTKIPQCHFDLVMSGFVLAHLTTTKELETVLRLAHGSLRAGGLSMHIIPATPTTQSTPKEGEAFEAKLPHPDGKNDILLCDVHWKESTYVEAMKQAGFCGATIRDLDFHPDTTEEWKEQNDHPAGYKLLVGRKEQ